MSDPAYAAQVSLVANRSNLWRMVGKERIDGVIADENTGAYKIQQLGLSDRIKPTAVVVSTKAAEVAFSKRSTDPAFVQAYADALRELVVDGPPTRQKARLWSTGQIYLSCSTRPLSSGYLKT